MEQAPEPLTFLTADEVKKLSGETANEISISYNDKRFDSRFEYDANSRNIIGFRMENKQLIMTVKNLY